ncbi:MAG: GNAT family N-acetyltransferase [Rubrobacteraceae bacterium]
MTPRAVVREDLPRLLGFWNDVEVELAGGGYPPRPTAPECLQKTFDRVAAESPRDKTDFAIEADDRPIGHCDLFHIDETSRQAELGITIGDKEYWGRGYGREAVSLLLGYAFRLQNLHRVWLEVHAENERAIRAYRSCGFVEEGRQREHMWLAGRYVNNVLMGILRREWGESEGGER